MRHSVYVVITSAPVTVSVSVSLRRAHTVEEIKRRNRRHSHFCKSPGSSAKLKPIIRYSFFRYFPGRMWESRTRSPMGGRRKRIPFDEGSADTSDPVKSPDRFVLCISGREYPYYCDFLLMEGLNNKLTANAGTGRGGVDFRRYEES